MTSLESQSAGAEARRVVVGVDGSEESLRALDVALAEAQMRGAVLEIVHAWSITKVHPPAPLSQGVPVPTHLMPDLEREAESVLAAAVAHVPADSGVTVESSLVAEDAATTLVEKSAYAEVLVVGSRGVSRLVEFVIGSTTKEIVDRSHCPVIVVPHEHGHGHKHN
jgi:nucleotide-binding universal stress UspA family protein